MTRITPVAELDEHLSYLKLHVHQGKLRNTGKTGGSKTVDACPIPALSRWKNINQITE